MHGGAFDPSMQGDAIYNEEPTKISHLHFSFVYLAIVCEPECQNGGTCSAPDVCDCATGYMGDQCQTGEFQCFRSAILLSIEICNCFCLAVCVPECQNGGTCSAPEVCDCATGYVGDSCQTCEFQCFQSAILLRPTFVFV